MQLNIYCNQVLENSFSSKVKLKFYKLFLMTRVAFLIFIFRTSIMLACGSAMSLSSAYPATSCQAKDRRYLLLDYHYSHMP